MVTLTLVVTVEAGFLLKSNNHYRQEEKLKVLNLHNGGSQIECSGQEGLGQVHKVLSLQMYPGDRPVQTGGEGPDSVKALLFRVRLGKMKFHMFLVLVHYIFMFSLVYILHRLKFFKILWQLLNVNLGPCQ